MRFSVSNILMLFWLMLMFVQPVQAKTSDVIIDDKAVCMIETQKQEKNFQIKEYMLTSIAIVESGRWNEKAKTNTPWPWTINAQGKGMFFETKAEAVKEVKRLQSQGVKSIDVGCMQINLMYHEEAFNSVEEAFDPKKNVEYGAKFLKKLYSRKGDWTEAAKSYHSSVSEKAMRYHKKVVVAYENTKKAKVALDSNFVLAKDNSDKIKLAKAENAIVAAERPAKAAIVPAKKPASSANEWREARLQEYRQRRMK